MQCIICKIYFFGKFFTSTIILYILLFAQNFYSCKKVGVTRAEVPTRKRAAELGGEWRRAAALVRQPVSSERLQQLGQQKWQGPEA
jgi:hypothetical protein